MQVISDERSKAFGAQRMGDKATGNDSFDSHYLQVILWDHINHHIVGG